MTILETLSFRVNHQNNINIIIIIINSNTDLFAKNIVLAYYASLCTTHFFFFFKERVKQSGKKIWMNAVNVKIQACTFFSLSESCKEAEAEEKTGYLGT